MNVLLHALQNLVSLQHIGYLCLGTIIGLLVAILPGMGGAAGLSVVLPFVYGMDTTSALALMIGLLAPTATGDTFPAVLMGIPGSNSSQATVLDGFPLAKKGKASMALASAFIASLAGGLIGAAVLTSCVYLARPFILSVGLGEQLLLIILALTMVGTLTGRSAIKGLAACGIGLAIGSIGAAPATGELRLTFGTVYLSDGIPLIVLGLGIYAMPEIFELLRHRRPISDHVNLGSGWSEGVQAAVSNWWLIVRCSGIGSIIGALPGLGGSVIEWIAYGHVVQSSKNKDEFGKGDVRGVIAPEAAVSAVRAGELVPTLFLGVPGSGAMAILLGGFVLVGIEPGLGMVTRHLDQTYTIIWSLALANVLGTAICVVLAQPIARLTLIPYGLIGPVMMVLIVFTSYQTTRSWGDLYTLMGVSAFGVLMKRFDWPRPALVIGYVLSHNFEARLYQTWQVYGFSFLSRVPAMIILAMIIVSVFVLLRASPRRNAAAVTPLTEGDERGPARTRPVAFTCLLIFAIACAIALDADKLFLSKLFPLTILLVTLVLLVVILIRQCFEGPHSPLLADGERKDLLAPATADITGVGRYFGWFTLLLLATSVVGYLLGVTLFLVCFLTVEVGRPYWRNCVVAAAAACLLATLAFVFHLYYPTGLLTQHAKLPWWMG